MSVKFKKVLIKHAENLRLAFISGKLFCSRGQFSSKMTSWIGRSILKDAAPLALRNNRTAAALLFGSMHFEVGDIRLDDGRLMAPIYLKRKVKCLGISSRPDCLPFQTHHDVVEAIINSPSCVFHCHDIWNEGTSRANNSPDHHLNRARFGIMLSRQLFSVLSPWSHVSSDHDAKK